METAVVMAITELLKLSMQVYASYLAQAGKTEAEIEAIFQEAKKGMFERDPANIPVFTKPA
jgi:hypothetical protein